MASIRGSCGVTHRDCYPACVQKKMTADGEDCVHRLNPLLIIDLESESAGNSARFPRQGITDIQQVRAVCIK